MSISPVQGRPIPQMRTIPKSPSPKGIGAIPDRLESRSIEKEEGPPSVFKKFLFDPAIQSIKWLLRGVFHFFDWLRSVAFEEDASETQSAKAGDRTFLSHLRTAPRAQELLFQFERHFRIEERDAIYRSVGEKYPRKISWKETVWKRSAKENVELGRRLVANNPERIRDHLANRLSELSNLV